MPKTTPTPITTKKEAVARVTAKDRQEIDALKERIEAAIATWDGQRLYVNASGISRRNADRVAAEYRGAGSKDDWIVEVHDSQMDGLSITMH